MKKDLSSVKVISITLLFLGIIQIIVPILIMNNTIKPGENTPFHISLINSAIIIGGALISLHKLSKLDD